MASPLRQLDEVVRGWVRGHNTVFYGGKSWWEEISRIVESTRWCQIGNWDIQSRIPKTDWKVCRKLGEGRISNDLGFLYLCSSEGLVDGLHYHTWRHLSFIGLTNCECIVWQEKYKDMWIVLVNTDHIIWCSNNGLFLYIYFLYFTFSPIWAILSANSLRSSDSEWFFVDIFILGFLHL